MLASPANIIHMTEWITSMREFLYEGVIANALSSRSIDASIALTLVAHSWNDESEADTVKRFRCWDEMSRDFLKHGDIAQLIPLLLQTPSGINLEKRREFVRYARLLSYFTRNRLAFGTSRGWLLGLGPPKAQVGDVVAVLHGAPTPFLLRPHKTKDVPDGTMQTWRLVGDCYVHGIMNGEGMDMAPEQTFTLV